MAKRNKIIYFVTTIYLTFASEAVIFQNTQLNFRISHEITFAPTSSTLYKYGWGEKDK
jgi:hypothetical protein